MRRRGWGDVVAQRGLRVELQPSGAEPHGPTDAPSESRHRLSHLHAQERGRHAAHDGDGHADGCVEGAVGAGRLDQLPRHLRAGRTPEDKSTAAKQIVSRRVASRDDVGGVGVQPLADAMARVLEEG